MSGDKAWSFSCWSRPKSPSPWALPAISPPPEQSAWYKQDKALKKQGVPKQQRPSQPPANPLYPTKQALALYLLAQFKTQQSRLQCQLYHGRCPLWYGILCRWRLGDMRRRAGDLANPQQSESPPP